MREIFTRKRLTIAGAAVGTLILLYAAVSWVIVGQALVAEVTAYDQQPEDLGLEYQDVTFSPRGDEDITLRGWWFPVEDASVTIIWVHGLDKNQGSRLPMMADILSLGVSVLTFDLRGHGESDKVPMGGSIREQRDLLGAIDFVVAEGLQDTGKIFLMGESYGGAISLLTGYQHPAVTGVFADSAFASLSDVVTKEVSDRTVIPAWGARILRPGIIWMGRLTKGININDATPLAVIDEYDYPLGFAVCQDDQRIPFEHTWSMRARAAGDSAFIAFPDCGHADGYDEFRGDFIEALAIYLDRRVGG